MTRGTTRPGARTSRTPNMPRRHRSRRPDPFACRDQVSGPGVRVTETWTGDELAGIGDVEEVEISVRRSDGALRDPVTVWVVRAGDDLYVRSAVKGRDAAWYRAVRDTHEGRVAGGRVERDIRFEDADPALN